MLDGKANFGSGLNRSSWTAFEESSPKLSRSRADVGYPERSALIIPLHSSLAAVVRCHQLRIEGRPSKWLAN